MIWQIEIIPDKDILFYRIHKDWMDDSDIKPGVFREIGEGKDKGMSTDWSKYSTPENSRARSQKAEKNGIIQFIVRNLREFGLKVIHAPIQNHPGLEDNRAHTNVKGIDKNLVQIRLKLLDIFEWQIMPVSN